MMNLLSGSLRPKDQKQPTLFQGFWHGPALGPLRQACLASFIGMGHSYELYTYERVAVPPGVRLRDAGQIIPLSEVFYYDNPLSGKPDIGPFSDLFRFKLLSGRGGWWSDVDAICLSSEIPSIDRAWAQEVPEWRSGAVGTSQIAFAAGDPVVVELYRRCLQLSKVGYSSRESLGPDLITSLIRELNLPVNVFGTPDRFYPIRWIEMFKLWLPEFKDEISARAKSAFFMPIYASFPQYIGLDLGRLPPAESFLGEICDRYLSRAQRNLARYSAEEVTAGTRSFLLRNKWAVEELSSVAGPEVVSQLGVRTKSIPSKWKVRGQVTRIDSRKIDFAPEDILCVIGIRNELTKLPHFLDYHRKLGVDRFLCMDNGSDDETLEYLLSQDDCHCFHTEGSHFALNTAPPSWSNAVLNAYCEGHWCVVVDGDELLVYPDSEHVPLPSFCGFLQDINADAMSAVMVDMYADGPLLSYSYEPGLDFVAAAPFFDPKPGWLRPAIGCFPPVQMFGGVRERAFWRGPIKRTTPPCLSKVPLVKWRKGMRYLAAQHTINQVDLAPVTGALLHFKFLTGFQLRAETEIYENDDLEEKGLQERKVYLDILKKEPKLTLRNSESVRYEGSGQLVRLGWMRSSRAYENFQRDKHVSGLGAGTVIERTHS